MSWEFWIERRVVPPKTYDELLMNICDELGIRFRGREREHVDVRQYLSKWYLKNQWKFVKYRSLQSCANLIGVKDHSGILYLANKRDISKRLNEYNKNTEKVAELLKNY